jgi:hypothetical protein
MTSSPAIETLAMQPDDRRQEQAGHPPRRRRVTAFVLSAFLCPGTGQMANGQWLKGGLMAAVSVALFAWLCAVLLRPFFASSGAAGLDLLDFLEGYRATLLRQARLLAALTASMLALWAYSAVDAWRGPPRS